jgi:putative transposase
VPALLFVHINWSTHQRMPMIGPSEAEFLKRFLPAEAQRHKATVLALGLVQDHVHLVVQLPAQFDISRLIQGFKGASARLANQDLNITKRGLRWNPGYSAVSVGRRQLQLVMDYVKDQARRHKTHAL